MGSAAFNGVENNERVFGRISSVEDFFSVFL